MLGAAQSPPCEQLSTFCFTPHPLPSPPSYSLFHTFQNKIFVKFDHLLFRIKTNSRQWSALWQLQPPSPIPSGQPGHCSYSNTISIINQWNKTTFNIKIVIRNCSSPVSHISQCVGDQALLLHYQVFQVSASNARCCCQCYCCWWSCCYNYIGKELYPLNNNCMQACADVQGSQALTERFECVAVWKEGR